MTLLIAITEYGSIWLGPQWTISCLPPTFGPKSKRIVDINVSPKEPHRYRRFSPQHHAKEDRPTGKIMQPLNDLQIAYILSDRHLLRHRAAFSDAAFSCRGRTDSCLAFKDFPKL